MKWRRTRQPRAHSCLLFLTARSPPAIAYSRLATRAPSASLAQLEGLFLSSLLLNIRKVNAFYCDKAHEIGERLARCATSTRSPTRLLYLLPAEALTCRSARPLAGSLR